MPIIGCTKENNCKRDAFLKARQLEAERTTGNPHKQGENTESKEIRETTVSSDVDAAPDLLENPDDVTRHASGNKYLDERAAALEEPVAVAQKEPVEISQATETVPETLVQTRPSDVR